MSRTRRSLAGFGSAAPGTEESHLVDVATTYYCRALGVIRGGTDSGTITVTARRARFGTTSVDLEVSPVHAYAYQRGHRT